MALPHPLPDIQGTTPVAPASTSAPSGYQTGVRFFGFGEQVKAETLNRSAYALSENDEYLYNIVGAQNIAYVEVVALSSFTGSSITIDPQNGGGHTIDYLGSIYLGESGWAVNQENRDRLFQLLDEEYNEVLVDGVEVKVTAVVGDGGAGVGDGFVDNEVITLTLSDTVPSANYRLNYCPGTTFENLPPYALIGADVRGLHEVAAEAGFKGMYILDADGTAPADFSGATALQDALAEVGAGCTLFLRKGAYSLAAVGGGQLSISQSDVTIIGTSANTTSGTRLVVDSGSGHNLTISGDHVTFRNLAITAASEGQDVDLTGADNCSFEHCSIKSIRMDVNSSSDYLRMDNCYLTSADAQLLYHLGQNAKFNQCLFYATGTTSTDPVVFLQGCSGTKFESCVINPATINSLQPAVRLRFVLEAGVSFENCKIVGGRSEALIYGAGVSLVRAKFVGCVLENSPIDSVGNNRGPVMPETVDVPAYVQMTFEECWIETTGVTAWYNGPFVQLLAQSSDTSETAMSTQVGFIELNNVRFSDNWCKGTDTAVDPGSTDTGTTPFPVMKFEGVIGNGVLYSRDAAYDIQDSEWLYTEDTKISRVRVLYDITNQPWVIDSSVVSEGMLNFNDGSQISDLEIVGFMGKGSILTDGQWERPLVRVQTDGQAFGESTIMNRSGISTLDGLVILQLKASLGDGVVEPYEWKFNTTADMGVVVLERGLLKRFRWSRTNKLCYSSGENSRVRCLVYTLEYHNIIERCQIHHEDAADSLTGSTPEAGSADKYGGVIYNVISCAGGTTIRDNSIIVEDAFAAPTNMLAVINVEDVVGTLWRINITDNNIECDDSNPQNYIIDLDVRDPNSLRARVSGNTINGDNSGGGSLTHIKFPSGGDAESLCVGNICSDSGGTAAIDPVSITGYSTNVLL